MAFQIGVTKARAADDPYSLGNSDKRFIFNCEVADMFMVRCDVEGGMNYSYRNATCGSTRVARRAGA